MHISANHGFLYISTLRFLTFQFSILCRDNAELKALLGLGTRDSIRDFSNVIVVLLDIRN